MYIILKRVGGYLRYYNGMWYFDFNIYFLNFKFKEVFIVGLVFMIDMKEIYIDDVEYNYFFYNVKYII